jgi:hypothetical protein
MLNETIKTDAEGRTLEVQVVALPIGIGSNGPRFRIGPEERVYLPKPVKKVIILGMGFSLWDFIHGAYGNPSHLAEEGTEVWAINYAGFVFRCDLVFNMHDFDDPVHKEVMSAYTRMPHTKVISIKSYDWMPNSYEYPLQEILEDPMCGAPYLENTTAYMIALAMASRAESILLYGCDFDYDPDVVINVGDKTEKGRSNVEYWLGRATSFGINVQVAQSGTLLNSSTVTKKGRILFYGYGDQYKAVFDAEQKWIGFEKAPSFDQLDEQLK